ncbi:MAG: proton-conducting membrane transporter [Myxococcales bacterium]|nr:proton-conducting membrane transporter [Myxococcales bacterium]
MSDSTLAWWLGGATVALPFAAVLPLLFLGGIGAKPSERATARAVLVLCGLSTLSAIGLAALWLAHDGPLVLRYGSIFDLGPRGHALATGDHGAAGYRFEVDLLVDRLSATMSVLSGVLSWLTARFSVRYLHREPGFFRYFLLLALFVGGMQIAVLAGSYDLLFVGWELAGISSMLLIAFFHLRRGPARAATRAMLTYRVTDVGLLVAGVLLHHFAGSSGFFDAFEHRAWPEAQTHLASSRAFVISAALVFAAIGKSALFPLGTWLPRAMEGPTPSSALFYGGLAVHAGVYLLLRSAPLIAASHAATVLVAFVGIATALWATIAGRTRSDVKSSLAYATVTQVGLMVVGVALRLYNVVLLYMVAHACLRTLQLLRAPSALHDAEAIRAALEEQRGDDRSIVERLVPAVIARRAHALALEDFHMDAVVERVIVRPVLALSSALDRAERRWVAAMTGVDLDAPTSASDEPELDRKSDAPRAVEGRS